jgi:hypothetical protein
MPKLGPEKTFNAPETAGKVVANCAVGLGPPDIETTGALGEGLGCSPEGDEPEARIVKRSDVVYVTPCVVLRKMRK